MGRTLGASAGRPEGGTVTDRPATENDGSLRYTPTVSIAVPQSGVENRIGIRKADWLRIKRALTRCQNNSMPGRSGWYFCLFGISGSAFLTVIPLAFSTGLPSWVVPAYICVAIGSGIVGLALVLIDRKLKTIRSDRLAELKGEMEEIEASFPQGQ